MNAVSRHSSQVQTHQHSLPAMMRSKAIQALMAVSGLMLAVIVVPPAVSAGSPEQCIDDWAKAAAIVQKRNIIDVAGLSRMARQKYDGKIMTARLCKSDDGYFYRLVIRRKDGRVQRVRVSAQRPAQ